MTLSISRTGIGSRDVEWAQLDENTRSILRQQLFSIWNTRSFMKEFTFSIVCGCLWWMFHNRDILSQSSTKTLRMNVTDSLFKDDLMASDEDWKIIHTQVISELCGWDCMSHNCSIPEVKFLLVNVFWGPTSMISRLLFTFDIAWSGYGISWLSFLVRSTLKPLDS